MTFGDKAMQDVITLKLEGEMENPQAHNVREE